jgi:hypothetical protein
MGYSGFLVIFYICSFIVVLIMLDFFYVSYSSKQKKFSFVWPLQALRAICQLVTTIFYMPILETFLSMFNCTTSSSGTRYLTDFPTV